MNNLIKIIKNKKSILSLILILGALFRGVNLGSSPPGVLVDEASLGYNAYSILQTSKDEWGAQYPLTLKSFGDYKPAGYAYAAIPFIKFLGLNPLSTRLPSAIAGLIALATIYSIGKSLFNDKNVGLIAAFILAITPWHIYMSRMAWEANVSLTLFLIGTAFILAKKQSSLNIIISAFFFSLSCEFYIGYRILTPLLLLPFLYYLIKNNTSKIKHFIIFIGTFLIFTLPIIFEIIFNGGGSRFNQVSIFQKSGNSLYINEQRAFCGLNHNSLLLKTCYLFWNKPILFATEIIKNYMNNFSVQFLFTEGNKAQFINNPNHGGLYMWLLIPFIFGLIYLLNDIKKGTHKYTLSWLLIAPVMPALADVPNFVRSNMLLIPIVIITSLGFWSICKILNNKLGINKSILVVLFVLFGLFSVGTMMIDYIFVYTKKVMAWDEYYNDTFNYVSRIENNYEKIYIKKITNNPYIYTLFYLSIDPNYVHKNINRNGFDITSIGKYIFTPANDISNIYCNWIKVGKPKSLFITDDTKLYPYSIYYSSSYNKVYKFAAVYDLNKIESNQKKGNINLPKCNIQ